MCGKYIEQSDSTPTNNRTRLILYYPVSALVTLFANILQNPQDARARGDLRLMTSVCSFLTMLERDAAEANGNVRRMLSVCSEFERIARLVLDKAEHEMRGRGKRKQAEREREKDRKDTNSIAAGLEDGKTIEMMQVETQASYRRPIQTPSLRKSMESSQQGSPASWSRSPAAASNADQKTPASPDTEPGTQQTQHIAPSSGQWSSQTPFTMSNDINTAIPYQQQDAGAKFQPQPQPQVPGFSQPGMAGDANFNSTTTGFSPPNPVMGLDMNGGIGFNAGVDMAGGQGSFQQPFVPQDLWQMPMTLEWDWAEGLGLGSFTPGPMFDYGFGDGGTDGLDAQMPGQGQQ